MASLTPIPSPPGLPIVGNYLDVDPLQSIKSLTRLADTYGEVFKLNLGGNERIFVSSYNLINELSDEKRFTKVVSGPLKEMRNCVNDGLFTANYGEHNWRLAHTVLIPAFGPLAIREMFDEMHDIASQLVMKWARFGPEEKIDVSSDFTKLAFDTLALCAMDTRFNSFYHEELHPFIDAMTGMLLQSGARSQRQQFVNDHVARVEREKFETDIAFLRKVAADVVAKRKNHPSDKKDLLNAMLKGRDPKTGEGLSDNSIMNNMITFLIAGHETTSGLLSFLFYYFLQNPSAFQAAQREIDDKIGRGPITADHLSKVPYLSACLREVLRLNPPISIISFQPLPTTTEDLILLGGKYEIHKGQAVAAIVSKMQRDTTIYGDDADSFRPERMLDESFSKLPPNAWKPFGNGMRACIGRPFAWQEALLTASLLLQNFNFRFDNSNYELSIKQTLTIKPKGLFMHATLRDHVDPVSLEKMLQVPSQQRISKDGGREGLPKSDGKPKKPMTILYGSNAGTCQSLGQSLARTASGHGYDVKVDPLDAAIEKVPTDRPVVIISSSYEGQPPDNAARFVAWLTDLMGDKTLADVKYTVFAVGNHDWASTFHRIPKLLDSMIVTHGATRIANMGLADVASGDVFNDFDKWQDEVFWPALGDDNRNEDKDLGLEIEIDTSARGSKLRQDVQEAVVLSNELLTKAGEPEKRYITLKLATETIYKAGDYLAVLPLNNEKNILRVLRRFNLPWDAVLTLKPGANTTLPTGYPISAMDILGAYVELSQPATRRNVQKIAASLADEDNRKALLLLAGDDFDTEVTAKHISALDILEIYPRAELPFNEFLTMLPPLRLRQYSISSSPLVDPTIATLTWTVLDVPSKVAGGTKFLGVASNYLARLEEGDRVHVAVKPSHGNFHLPKDIENTPIIMICAGTGIAPFHGFIGERATQIRAGRRLAPAYLFVGCNHPDRDRLFVDEIKQWEDSGVVKAYYAYMLATERSKGAKFVQDRLWEERKEMATAFEGGARIYICGSNLVGQGVTAVIKRIYSASMEGSRRPKTEAEVDEWFDSIKGDRYVSDVFA